MVVIKESKSDFVLEVDKSITLHYIKQYFSSQSFITPPKAAN